MFFLNKGQRKYTNMAMNKTLSLPMVLIIIMISNFSYAQEGEEPKNVLLLSFGYTHIPSGAELEAADTKSFFVPAIGIDYGHIVGKRWEIGIMLDIELDHYLIVKKELERENAFIAVAGVAYNPVGHLYVFGGVGVEIEKNQNLFVLRLGTEYAIHLSDHWALAPAFYFDWKEDYDTYALSLGLRYSF